MRAFSLTILLAALSGCATLLPTPQPPVTQTVDAGPDVFDCALSTLTELGYTVADAERDVFVRAERRTHERERFLILVGDVRATHILTVTDVDGLLRVTADLERIRSGDDHTVYSEPYGPDAETLRDADAVLAACAAPSVTLSDA
ncbi:MAG: hypothetical protein AAF809_12345 [Bacteroidota bacterium]